MKSEEYERYKRIVEDCLYLLEEGYNSEYDTTQLIRWLTIAMDRLDELDER